MTCTPRVLHQLSLFVFLALLGGITSATSSLPSGGGLRPLVRFFGRSLTCLVDTMAIYEFPASLPAPVRVAVGPSLKISSLPLNQHLATQPTLFRHLLQTLETRVPHWNEGVVVVTRNFTLTANRKNAWTAS